MRDWFKLETRLLWISRIALVPPLLLRGWDIEPNYGVIMIRG